MIYTKYIKRPLDLIFSLSGFIVLSPLFVIIYILLYNHTNKNPIFYQRRPGKDEKIFSIMKFKTMTEEKDANGDYLPDEERLTKLGNFLRKTSLDEIPQLLNVIKGEMSLVGPRPLRVRYLPFYSEIEKIRHTVLPGVTGLAQVSGRNSLTWDQKLAYDVEYVENISFILDLKILLKTFYKVIGASSKEIILDVEMDALDTYRTKNKS